MTAICLSSPAKINLRLQILGRREEGYHDLSMLMEKISLFDKIVLEKIAAGIEVVSPQLDIPLEKNLVWKAAQGLAEASETFHSPGVRIHLSKNIPMGGGLGGGSGNAATVLKGLNEFWGLHWTAEKLAKIGVKLGADIPFFLYDGPAQVEGLGERINSLGALPKLWIILINPGIYISTPWAYQAWDDRKAPKTFCKGLTEENQSVRRPNTFGEVIEGLHNDFEAVVVPQNPEIRWAKEALLEVGAAGALMSGSGSTVFGLFEKKENRDRALRDLKNRPGWRVFAVENNWGVDKR